MLSVILIVMLVPVTVVRSLRIAPLIYLPAGRLTTHVKGLAVRLGLMVSIAGAETIPPGIAALWKEWWYFR